MYETITQWHLPSNIIFGRGAVGQLGQLMAQRGFSKPLLLTDSGIATSGMLGQVTKVLEQANIEFATFTNVVPEPPFSCLEAAQEQAAQAGACDCVIGIGGGSVLDVAKAMALLLRHGGHVRDYIGTGAVKQRGLPIIAIPTTAGTGSEVTGIAIFTDTQANLKVGIVSPLIIPDLALVDPQLTDTMPPHVTSATGLDALTHAIEAMISRKTNPFSQSLSLHAVRLIGRSLRTAYRDAANQQARDDMAVAATLAGLAFANSSCCAVHALAYPLGGRHHVPHGQANAMLLAPTMRFNAPVCDDQFRQLATAMELDDPTSDGFVAELEALRDDLNIPGSLKDIGVTADEIPGMARDAVTIERLMKPNPRPVTAADAQAIYESVYS